MATNLALSLARTVERELPALCKLSDEQAALPRSPGKWSAKEELGHLIGSVANNHVRFVRGTLEPQMQGPGYAWETAAMGLSSSSLDQKRLSVVVIDSRGHARSTRGSRPYSYDLMASDVLAVMDTVHLDEAALVGWSDGACTALILAAKAPSRAAGVFFLCLQHGSERGETI